MNSSLSGVKSAPGGRTPWIGILGFFLFCAFCYLRRSRFQLIISSVWKKVYNISSYKTVAEHFPNENWVISCLIQKKRMTVRIGVCQLILFLALTRYLIPGLFMISPLSAPIHQTTRALRWKGASKLWVSVMKCQLRVGGRSHKSYRSSLISPGLCRLIVRSPAEECSAKKQVRKSH